MNNETNQRIEAIKMTTITALNDRRWDVYAFALLDFAPDGKTFLDLDPEAPMLYAVWCDDDILGAGDSAEEAIEDARDTVAGWEATCEAQRLAEVTGPTVIIPRETNRDVADAFAWPVDAQLGDLPDGSNLYDKRARSC